MQEEEIIAGLYGKSEFPLDDCYWDGFQGLVTTDCLTEGTHFRHDWSGPQEIAIKLVEVNVSDILASGGKPDFALLQLGLSEISRDPEWVRAFSESLRSQLNLYSIRLVGGDTYRSQVTTLGLTLWGKLESKSGPWTRTKASPGDQVFLSGPLGLSVLGLKFLESRSLNQIETGTSSSKAGSDREGNQKQSQFVNLPLDLKNRSLEKHKSPRSRMDLADRLFADFRIRACMDITDGLISDLQKLAFASQVDIHVYLEKIPGSQELLTFLTWSEILSSGEELELVWTSPQNSELEPRPENSKDRKSPGTIIGSIHPMAFSTPTVIYYWEGVPKEITNQGFQHFSD